MDEKLFDELEKEFGSKLAEEMIAMIICGYTVDSAIQSVLEEV